MFLHKLELGSSSGFNGPGVQVTSQAKDACHEAALALSPVLIWVWILCQTRTHGRAAIQRRVRRLEPFGLQPWWSRFARRETFFRRLWSGALMQTVGWKLRTFTSRSLQVVA